MMSVSLSRDLVWPAQVERPVWVDEQKRQVVAANAAPDASVAQVAMSYG